MCRLLGMATAAPSTFARVLGHEQLDLFRQMSVIHHDGWGAGSVATMGQAPVVHRATRRAGADRAFDAAMSRDELVAGIVHLRWASAGMATSGVNTHPFDADGVAFAHNGYIAEAAELDSLFSDAIDRHVHGSTDSERYFALVRWFVREGATLSDAIALAVQRLRRQFPEASLNALVLDAHNLIAVHSHRSAEPAIEQMRRVGYTEESLPHDHLDAYYLMRMRVVPGSTVAFASTGLESDGWQPLPPDSITTVDLATLTQTSVAVTSPRSR